MGILLLAIAGVVVVVAVVGLAILSRQGSTLDRFRAYLLDPASTSRSTITGGISNLGVLVSGRSATRGLDSQVSLVFSYANGTTQTAEQIIVGDVVYSRANGGTWTSQPAGALRLRLRSLSEFLAQNLVDEGAGPMLAGPFRGRDLHLMALPSGTYIDVNAYGITCFGQPVTGYWITFYVADDGTPVVMSEVCVGTDAGGAASPIMIKQEFSDVGAPITIAPPVAAVSRRPRRPLLSNRSQQGRAP
jgi:hypothetical protein